eukprot:6558859-Prymnesium_polylepis.1
MPTAAERVALSEEKGGIFIVDHFGKMYAGQKVAGLFQHSSMTCGHCCKFAGGITVREGQVVSVSPHSGHYIPTQPEYDDIVESWTGAGLDLSKTELRSLIKDKKVQQR